MSVTSFKKASRAAKYLRILIEGPSGSGKTWGALLIAYGMIKLLGEGEILLSIQRKVRQTVTHT